MNNYKKSVIVLSPKEQNVYTVENSSKLRLPKPNLIDSLIFGATTSLAIVFPYATVLGISGLAIVKICKRLDALTPSKPKEPQGLQPVKQSQKVRGEVTEFTHCKKTVEYYD